jgi:hypothetical protein
MPRKTASGRAGITARLQAEDWTAMAAPANRGRWERWLRLAREANPRLDDKQVERLAAHMQREHCAKMARLSAQARRIKAELAELEGAGGGGAA